MKTLTVDRLIGVRERVRYSRQTDNRDQREGEIEILTIDR